MCPCRILTVSPNDPQNKYLYAFFFEKNIETLKAKENILSNNLEQNSAAAPFGAAAFFDLSKNGL